MDLQQLIMQSYQQDRPNDIGRSHNMMQGMMNQIDQRSYERRPQDEKKFRSGQPTLEEMLAILMEEAAQTDAINSNVERTPIRIPPDPQRKDRHLNRGEFDIGGKASIWGPK